MSIEQQQTELRSTIWKIANDLRGSVDGWDFKVYVLDMLFYRFISENLTRHLNESEQENDPSFNYLTLDDEVAENIEARTQTIQEKGFYILPSQLFENVRKKAKNNENLNETLRTVFNAIEESSKGTESENDFKGLFADLDVNSNKLGGTIKERNEKLLSLINAVGDMKFNAYEDSGVDAFGDAYEYLMNMYASTAGKSGGEFFTPQEVSELLAEITIHQQETINKVYDPACGSGSLLLKFSKVLSPELAKNIEYFGQEVNITTYNLCRINMFLHNINYDRFEIAHGDTLTNPQHLEEKPFDAIVSNPPYSTKWKGAADPILINDERFTPAGVLAPKSKADLAFTMHILSHLSEKGTAAIVEFPGVLYRGSAEQKIRKYLIENNYIDTVIQLPANLFFGVSIATCILVLKKNKTDNQTLFIDASEEFEHVGNKNKLTEKHRLRVLEAYKGRKDIPHFAQLVKNETLLENDSNLTVSSYVEGKDTTEKIDITILNQEIDKIVAHENELRTAIRAIVKELEGGNNE